MLRGRIGQVIAQRYELLEIIGSGGQSVVYRARDLVDGDQVALKVLGWFDPDASERMFREAFAMCQLQDTAAVRVLHQATTDDGSMALVMELLQGRDLSALLKEREPTGWVADAPWVRKTFAPIVRTLEAAHARGIVHRDLKTENVFLIDEDKGGGVRLLDFGFAKLLRVRPITGREVMAGSPSFLAPEVWQDGSANVDPRADVYALGVVLYRVLAGRLPFRGSALELMQAVTMAERPSLHAVRPDLSEDIDGWVRQVLAIRVEDRFGSVTAAWRALLSCLP